MARGGEGAGTGTETDTEICAAILDLDGTLVHTLGDFVEALQRMLRDLPEPYASFRVDASIVEPLVGKGSENLIKSLVAQVNIAQSAIKNGANTRGAGVAECSAQVKEEPATRAGDTEQGALPPRLLDANDLFDFASTRYQHHYADVNGQLAEVYPGVLEGLQALKALGWPLACVTNKPTAFAQDLLRAKGLDGFFVLTLGGDALPRKKPDPLPLTTACARLGVSPLQTLMVGDSSNDAQAARAAGCPVWLMTYGYNHGQPIREVDADGFVDSLSALPWLR